MKRRLFTLALALSIILGLVTPAFASGYEVVFKSDLKGSANTASGDLALFYPSSASGRRLARYTGSSIEYVTKKTYAGGSELYPCGYAVVDYKNVINSQGEYVYPVGEYDHIERISNDGYALAYKTVNGTNEYYLLNVKEGTAAKCPNNSRKYGNGLFMVQLEDNNYYYVDISGNKVLGPYGRSSEFCNGYAWVMLVEDRVENGWQIIDTKGNVITTFDIKRRYDKIFWNEPVVIPDEFLYGLYYKFPASVLGNEVSPDGLIKVVESYWVEKSYDRYGYTDLSGNIVIPCGEYGANSRSFINGYAVVEKEYENNNNQCGIIDMKGNVVVPIGLYKNLSNVTETGLVWATDQEGYLSILKVTPHPSGLAMPTTPAATTPTAPTQTPSATGFIDVSSDAYYAAAVTWAIDKGITNGTGTNTFSPADNCSNAQIITFLWRAKGQPEPTTSNPFTNISTNDYYYKAAMWAYENGMVAGGTFDVNTPCTRATTVNYIWIASGRPAANSNSSFSDVPVTASYAQAVSWAVENNITNGDGDNTFSPDKVCNRGQIVTFLNRAFS